MNRENGLERWGWVLLPLLLALTLGLAPRAVRLDRALVNAREALETGRQDAASRELGEVLRLQPWRSSLLEPAGLAALAAGDPQLAAERLELAVERGAVTSAGYLALGDAHRALGEWDRALEHWETALAMGAAPAPVHRRLLEAHRRSGDYAAAIADLQALAQLEPGDAAVHYQLGLLLAAREPQSALAALLQAAELDADLEDAVRRLQGSLEPDTEVDDPALVLLNAGRALAGLGEWTLAAEAFRQALLLNPGYADAWAFLGEAMGRLGMDGTEMLDTALEIDPDSLAANLLYALKLRRAGDPEAALAYIERARAIAPEAPAVAAETAQAYAEMGDVNSAIEYFLRAVDLAEEGDPTYLHLLAMFSIYNEVQIEEIGLAAARTAVLMDAGDPVALDLIGYAYAIGGDPVSGMRFLYRALNADPAYAPARLHLGMLFLAQEEPELARAQLAMAMSLAPGSAAAVQAQEILDQYLP